ncbi:S41 family peptidase [Lewinella sp. IMCC34191]|uniref:S41 family peptidase n=1 Tax=Lewinella sp. IMCC34191 TaxID=2259172 RepID=UPI00130059DD|nr:S41 family peptidase [Lewinella sp. IMCC34191]
MLLAQSPSTSTSTISDFPAATWTANRLIDSTFAVRDPDSGGTVIRISSPFTGYGSGGVYRELPVNAEETGVYEINARIRTEEVRGQGAFLYAYGKSDSNLSINYVASPGLTGQTDWQEVSIRFLASAGMDSVRIGCFLIGEGTANFGEVSIDLIPPQLAPPDTIRTYLDTFFDIVSENALGKEDIDWAILYERVVGFTVNARLTADIYPILQWALREINPHSFLLDPATASRWSSGDPAQESDIRPDTSIVVSEGHWIDEDVAYLTVPFINSGHEPTLGYYASALQSVIRQLDRPGLKGWVVDLRENTGGNCWPMLAGVGPLLGEGICGYFIKPGDDLAEPWSYRAGTSYLDSVARVSVEDEVKPVDTPKIAVLTGPNTTSSGEVVTVAFRGLANCRSFGQPTGGYSTSNGQFHLPDGAIINLTVSVYADRDKHLYGRAIPPDVVSDRPLKNALEWLRE